MKKKFIIVAIISILVVFVALFFRPIPIVPSGSEVTVHSIWYNWEDITDEVDVEAVGNILRGYYTRRRFNSVFPSLVEDEVWDIGIIRRSGPMRISLGRTNALYRSGSDTIIHRVINYELLMEELRGVIY